VSAAYSINGRIEWIASEGFSDMESKTKFTENTLTRIASITKPFTAICIMQLVENGALNLDDDIKNYIPDYPQKGKTPITIRHLLTHTSGIGGYKNAKEATSKVEYSNLVDVTKVFRDRKLSFTPGTDFLYTSYGYVLLGLIIEAASRISYEEYLQKNILDIADMKNTGVEKYGKVYPDKSVLYHMEKGKVVIPESNNLSNRMPAGGLYSTVNDMMKFGRAVMDYQLVYESTLKEMTKIGFPIEEGNPYGLGWFLYGSKGQEQQIIGHEGGQYGANTQIFLLPKFRSTVVVLSNTSETPNSNIKVFAAQLLEKIISENQN
jgi:CubicO group peptidase (beta-lactamase class C family)